jgi:hypothetical protein
MKLAGITILIKKWGNPHYGDCPTFENKMFKRFLDGKNYKSAQPIIIRIIMAMVVWSHQMRLHPLSL